jgi:MFS family permease
VAVLALSCCAEAIADHRRVLEHTMTQTGTAGRHPLLSPGPHHLDARVAVRHHPHADRGRCRIWFPMLAAALVVVLLGANLPSPLYVFYRDRFGFGAGVLTVIFAAYAAGVLAALLCFGRASDHLGRRPVLAVGLGLAAASGGLFLGAVDAAMLFAARAVSGLAVGLVLGAATAALAELEPSGNLRRAALVSAVASLTGFGLGPLVAGILAQFAPAPLRLVYGVYLVLLVLAGVVIAVIPETVRDADRRIDLRPSLAVPASIRAAFLPAALGIFSAFSILGFFAALVSSILRTTLHQPSPTLAGAVVFAVFGVAALAEMAGHRLRSATATGAGLGLLLASLGLLQLSLELASIAVFLTATTVAGAAIGLTFLGSLGAVDRLAPAGQRCAVLSALFVAAYLGFSVPVIGIGIGAGQAGIMTATGVAAVALAVVIGCAVLLLARALVHRLVPLGITEAGSTAAGQPR